MKFCERNSENVPKIHRKAPAIDTILVNFQVYACTFTKKCLQHMNFFVNFDKQEHDLSKMSHNLSDLEWYRFFATWLVPY